MDLGSIVGLVAAIAFTLISILWSVGWDVGKAKVYIDIASVMITVGGSVATIFLAVPISRVTSALVAVKKIFMPPKLDPSAAISNIISLSNLARRESLLALEDGVRTLGIDDPFLQKGIMLVVDGADPELIKNVLDTEMAYIEGRHGDVRGVWEFWGGAGPAWGMIGTLIGLINMLNDLSDPNALGPQMAIALITTMYGSLIANLICTPFANKLKVYSNDEMLLKEVLVEGILSIQAGDNPRIIEEKLKSFLSPALRKGRDDAKPEGEM